jgi:hypothetical protein
LCYFHEYDRDILDHPVSTKDLATPFEMNKCFVRRNLRQCPQEPGPLGRHKALDAQSEAALVAMLLDAFQAGEPMTKKELLQIVRGTTSKDSDASVGKCFHWHTSGRPRSQLEEHINTLKVHLTGKCRELVFNLDELGSAEWLTGRIGKSRK